MSETAGSAASKVDRAVNDLSYKASETVQDIKQNLEENKPVVAPYTSTEELLRGTARSAPQ